MSRVLDPFECDCSCHTEEARATVIHTVHIGPCCEPCPHCGKKITIGDLDRHMTEHCHMKISSD